MLKILVALFLFLQMVPGRGQDRNRGTKKPNIILFVADDLGAKDIEPYGNKIVRTPNLTRFANQSLLFSNAFATSPTCGPSRSSILTGLMPFRHGAHGNHSAVKVGSRSLVQYLSPLGYRVAIAGKLHVGPQAVFPFEYIHKTNVVERGFENRPGLNYDLNVDPVHKWLGEQQRDKPFMLVIADHSPHVVWPEKAEYNPKEVDIPAKHVDTEAYRRSRARYYTDITKMDSNFGKVLKSLEYYGLDDNTLVVFTADQGPQWAFGKWNLYDDGIQVPLLVRWPAVAKGGSRTDALVSLVDLMPTFVEVAKGKAPHDLDGESILPLIPGNDHRARDMVFASHTGDGQINRAPSRMLRTRRYKYILNLAPEIPYTTHMDLAKDHDGGREYWDSWREHSFKDEHAAAVLWKYHNRPREELYDLEADPLEMRNIAGDEKYASTLADFRIKLAAWRAQQGDEETGVEVIAERNKPKGTKPLAPYVFLD